MANSLEIHLVIGTFDSLREFADNQNNDVRLLTAQEVYSNLHPPGALFDTGNFFGSSKQVGSRAAR